MQIDPSMLPENLRQAFLDGRLRATYTLEKYEGDPPRWRFGFTWKFPFIGYREDKRPFEVITGGDDMPQTITHPEQD